ncbi:hypothetical protein HNQ50_002079 [Silvimonas terrae]|uniref:Uncharacterized protein n=1 Tax=Silvimonas terrae TaxID=300266 RepID=A0A840RCZ7_9NEIS|nr:hypothetical protein [Silvimonas terrae]MBB5191349.1 hypothetical protein [Silvimonas terrae]
MNWRGLLSGSFAVLATAFYVAWNQGWLPTRPATAPVPLACADLALGCNFTLDDHAYRIQSDQPITPARPFSLMLFGTPLTSATASWQMAGMDMGPNRFHFAPGPAGQWQTRTALPFCTQARSDWLLTLNVNKNKVIFAIQRR